MGEASTIVKVHFARTRLPTRLFSRRRGSIRALCLHLNQAPRLFQFSRTPKMCFAVDQTTGDLSFARHARRSDQRKVRTHGRKRALTTTADHPSSTGQTHGMRNEVIEELPLELEGEGNAKLDATLMSSGRNSENGSEPGRRGAKNRKKQAKRP
jgi:hypothetical protein